MTTEPCGSCRHSVDTIHSKNHLPPAIETDETDRVEQPLVIGRDQAEALVFAQLAQLDFARRRLLTFFQIFNLPFQ